ncbi:hypothetical protein U1Q18_020109 [Sarracenia purpurea var. burkii]
MLAVVVHRAPAHFRSTNTGVDTPSAGAPSPLNRLTSITDHCATSSSVRHQHHQCAPPPPPGADLRPELPSPTTVASSLVSFAVILPSSLHFSETLFPLPHLFVSLTHPFALPELIFLFRYGIQN